MQVTTGVKSFKLEKLKELMKFKQGECKRSMSREKQLYKCTDGGRTGQDRSSAGKDTGILVNQKQRKTQGYYAVMKR